MADAGRPSWADIRGLRQGDRLGVLAEVVCITSDGPQVRVRTAWGGWAYFTPTRDAMTETHAA